MKSKSEFVSDLSEHKKSLTTLIVSILFFAGLATVPSGVGAADSEDGWKIIPMRVTAYCPCEKCCGQWADGVTANGHEIKPGDRFVAADRRFPFGTRMIIKGYNNSNTVKVYDRGGAIKGNKLDVFFNTHQEALEWGVRHIDVKVK